MTDGTNGPDNMTGTSNADVLNGLGGDDRLNAGSRATEPTPSFYDLVDGGDGIDTWVVNASSETQSVTLDESGNPDWYLTSTSGNFRVDANNIEKIEFTGGSGNDSVYTGAIGVIVDGGAGDDYWRADLGALTAGVGFTLGSTSAIAAAGLTSITGIEKLHLTTGSGNDTLTGGTFADTLVAGGGNDRLDARSRAGDGLASTDVIDGGLGTDTWVVNAASETQSVTLDESGNPDWFVTSTSGNFRVDVNNIEKIEFTGGSGNDSIYTAAIGTVVHGGGGNDYWRADLSALTTGIRFILGTTSSIGAAGLTAISGLEKVRLNTGAGKDTLTGGSFADRFETGDGNDLIDVRTRGSEASADVYDVVLAGAGTDTLVVDASAETQRVVLDQSPGNPPLTVTSVSGNFHIDGFDIEKVRFTGGSGNDHIDTRTGGVIVQGGAGIDDWRADYSALTAKIVFELGSTTDIAPAGLVSIGGVEQIYLLTGSGKDKIAGGDYADRIETGDGNDLINAGKRFGETGSAVDVVLAGAGVDTLTVDATGETQAVFVTVGGSPPFTISSATSRIYVEAYDVEKIRLFGGAGNDTATGGGQADAFNGGDGNDTLNGAAGADALNGEDGNDSLIGGLGADSLAGGAGNDVLNGGDSSDRLTGNAGQDTLTGGAASDTFVFRLLGDSNKNAPDLIADLANSDVIDLSLIDANTGVGGDQAFAIVAAFTHAAGQAVLAFSGGVTTLSVDVDGDAKADSVIAITGDHHTHGGFVL